MITPSSHIRPILPSLSIIDLSAIRGSKNSELKSYKHKFLKRLDHYHELERDEKERAKVDPNKLLKEFERDTSNDPFKGTSIEGKD